MTFSKLKLIWLQDCYNERHKTKSGHQSHMNRDWIAGRQLVVMK